MADNILTYQFHIRVDVDGKQTPSINTPYGYYEFLFDLANDHLITSIGVNSELIKLEEVIHGRLDKHHISSSDWCIIEVSMYTCLLYNVISNDYNALEVPTPEIKSFLENWKDFLEKYEKGQIPGLVLPATLR
jgi:hypothetical protein